MKIFSQTQPPSKEDFLKRILKNETLISTVITKFFFYLKVRMVIKMKALYIWIHI